MGSGNWLADIVENQALDSGEQNAMQIRVAEECKTILRSCPLFVARLTQMITDDDNRIDTMIGDNLYKAIGARGRVKDIYGNLLHWAEFKSDIKEGK